MSHYLVMAGGTGGHIFPALAVAQKIEKLGHQVVWLGSEDSMETQIIPQYHIQLETISIKGIRGNGIKRKLTLPFILLKSVWQSMKIIKRNKIKGAIGFGGFVSFPSGIAAKLMKIPLIIHEQNAVAGLSNKILAKIADQIFYAFPEVFTNSDGLVGNPVRESIVHMQIPAERFKNRNGKLKMLVMGGSLGAKVFNEQIPVMLSLIPENNRPLIKHQCGKGNLSKVQSLYRTLNLQAEVVEFIDDIAAEYHIADFVVCRAGALTVSELAAAGIGGYLIPYPFAVDNHQTYNADYLVKGAAAITIQQSDLSIEKLAKLITHLTREQCLKWAENARQLAMLDADLKIAKKMIELN